MKIIPDELEKNLNKKVEYKYKGVISFITIWLFIFLYLNFMAIFWAFLLRYLRPNTTQNIYNLLTRRIALNKESSKEADTPTTK